ncbi:UNVERIFIED_CONTAM: hypothetical protein Sangu_0566600 [Sesamum angustifolium]|uniref:Uncharacterized protein n=1 Tax=Sesamum angustifolium TaxID=2727405 RepID=A0AAW2QAX2_9LAMI
MRTVPSLTFPKYVLLWHTAVVNEDTVITRSKVAALRERRMLHQFAMSVICGVTPENNSMLSPFFRDIFNIFFFPVILSFVLLRPAPVLNDRTQIQSNILAI